MATMRSMLSPCILSEIKLADLTIGDLAGLGFPTKETQAEPEKPTGGIRPLLRRV